MPVDVTESFWIEKNILRHTIAFHQRDLHWQRTESFQVGKFSKASTSFSSRDLQGESHREFLS